MEEKRSGERRVLSPPKAESAEIMAIVSREHASMAVMNGRPDAAERVALAQIDATLALVATTREAGKSLEYLIDAVRDRP